ncbi:MAG: c-type cytochrome [Rhodospirillaceae bacterium]
MSENHTDEHETFIKTPKQLITVVVLAFVVPIALIVLLTQLATRQSGVNPEDPAYSEEAVAKRLKPVGEVVIADASGATAEKTGQQVVEAVCGACHATGALNAPKIGDKEKWKPLIAQGHDKLTQTAIHGIRAMPPRGGNPDLTDTEIARAVAYMANQAGANFKEPAAKPAAAAPAATAAATPAPASAAPAAAKGGDAGKGKAVFDSTCAACHATGVAGAPKVGDKAAWAPRIKAGLDALHASALKGKGAMPPKGGNPSVPDADIAAAVDYMVGQSK